MNSVEQGVREVMAAVFDVSPNSIDVTASPDTLEKWDSLQHLNLILALEERFGIQFSLDEIAAMNGYGPIVALVSQYVSRR
jgi:acyl carrier protein